ncbi:MAG TPA: universal stress protein [Allosphingosinicella sp.]
MDRILVATHFSPRSDRALQRAVLIAQRTRAAITLVHVVDADRPDRLIAAETSGRCGSWRRRRRPCAPARASTGSRWSRSTTSMPAS